MRKRFTLALFFIAVLITARSQSADQTVLSAAGGSSLTPHYTLDWTMGEFAVETISASGKMYTQGFHQPLQVLATVAPESRSGIVYNISIAPNPVLTVLNFSINSANKIRVFVTVADINGTILKQYNISSADGTLQINMNTLPAGTYTLTVRDGVGAHIIKTYRVIKG